MAVGESPGSDGGWAARQAEIRGLADAGEPVEAMKAIMRELRDFSTRCNVLEIGIDTSLYYKNPAAFGRALKEVDFDAAAVAHFAGILAERGAVFLSLAQPGRALQDLEAADEIHREGLDDRSRSALELAREQVARELDAERRAEAARRVPVTVLTGFLGAGKTTLLNYILRARHGRRYAVIENEVGQIGIDNQLLQGATAERTEETITLLDNGCLCCTVRSDLITAVKQILDRADARAANLQAAGEGEGQSEVGRPPLDAILIETTGLADPGPVCKTFYVEEHLRARARMDGVLTVVDACHFLQQLRRPRSSGAVNESAQQVGFADRLLLNKVDVVDEAALQEVEAEIRSINAACPVYRCSIATRPHELPLDELLVAESFSLDRVLRDLAEPDPAEPSPKRTKLGVPAFCASRPQAWRAPSRHDTGIRTTAFQIEGAPLVLERFLQVMNTIRKEKAADLYRYKGAVCVKESSGVLKRGVLQGVHDMCQFEPRGRWPADLPPKSQLVFIGRDLDSDLWGRLFEKTKEGTLEELPVKSGGAPGQT